MADNIERLIGGENLQSEKEKGGLIGLREAPINVSPDVANWLKKIERDPMTITQVINDSGAVVSPVSPPTKTQLPISRNIFLGGFKKSVNETGRWLSFFLLRIIKKEAGNVKFNEE